MKPYPGQNQHDDSDRQTEDEPGAKVDDFRLWVTTGKDILEQSLLLSSIFKSTFRIYTFVNSFFCTFQNKCYCYVLLNRSLKCSCVQFMHTLHCISKCSFHQCSGVIQLIVFQCGRKGQGSVYLEYESLKKILRSDQCGARFLAQLGVSIDYFW